MEKREGRRRRLTRKQQAQLAFRLDTPLFAMWRADAALRSGIFRQARKGKDVFA